MARIGLASCPHAFPSARRSLEQRLHVQPTQAIRQMSTVLTNNEDAFGSA